MSRASRAPVGGLHARIKAVHVAFVFSSRFLDVSAACVEASLEARTLLEAAREVFARADARDRCGSIEGAGQVNGGRD
jgi:hypothetical protein